MVGHDKQTTIFILLQLLTKHILQNFQSYVHESEMPGLWVITHINASIEFIPDQYIHFKTRRVLSCIGGVQSGGIIP